jgi:hypothetical protein
MQSFTTISNGLVLDNVILSRRLDKGIKEEEDLAILRKQNRRTMRIQ